MVEKAACSQLRFFQTDLSSEPVEVGRSLGKVLADAYGRELVLRTEAVLEMAAFAGIVAAGP